MSFIVGPSGNWKPKLRSLINWGHRQPSLSFAIILIGLIVIFYGPGLVQPTSIMGGDAMSQFGPWLRFGWQSIRQGEWPLWDPYTFSGHPFLANPQTGLFYPPYWLLLFSPTPTTMEVIAVLHLFLLGLFTFWFGREIGLSWFASTISALAFAFSQYTVARLWSGHLNVVATVTWLPLLFLLVRRSSRSNSSIVLIGSLSAAMILLPGFLQVAYHVLLASGCYVVFLLFGSPHTCKLRLIVSWIGMVAGGLALSAVQLLPTYELLLHSSRGGGVGYSFATEGSFPPWYLITSFAPGFFGGPGGVSLGSLVPRFGISFPDGAVYVGAVPVVLILFAVWSYGRNKSVRFFTALGIAFLLLSMGRYSPLHRVFYHLVPGYDRFRIPAHHFVIVIFSLSILTGWGIEYLWRHGRATVAFRLSVGFLVMLAGMAISGSIVRDRVLDSIAYHLSEGVLSRFMADASPQEVARLRYLPDLYDNAVRSLWLPFLLLLGFCLWWLVFSQSPLREWAGRAALALLVLGGLFTFNLQWYRQSWVYYEPVVRSTSLLKREFLHQEEPFRVLLLEGDMASPVWRFTVNRFGLEERIEVINGYDPIILADYARYIGLITGDDNVESTSWMFVDLVRPHLLDLLNVRYVLAGESIPYSEEYNWRFLGQEDGMWQYMNPHARPRAYLVEGKDAIFVQTRSEAFKKLITGLAPPTTLIECSGLEVDDCAIDESNTAATPIQQSNVKIADYRSNYVRLAVATSAPAYVVLSDIYYPGWAAYVDGVRRDILRANAILRAVRIGPGDHIVEFRFAPSTVMWGAIVSGVTFVLFAFLGIRASCRYHSPWR